MSLTQEAEVQDEATRLRAIRGNETLADRATGIDNHPKPVLETSPLVSPIDERSERPYAQ